MILHKGAYPLTFDCAQCNSSALGDLNFPPPVPALGAVALATYNTIQLYSHIVLNW